MSRGFPTDFAVVESMQMPNHSAKRRGFPTDFAVVELLLGKQMKLLWKTSFVGRFSEQHHLSGGQFFTGF